MHPLTRLVIVLCLSSFSLLYQKPALLALVALICLLLLLTDHQSYINRKKMAQSLLRLLPVILSVFILQIFFTRQGDRIFTWGWLIVTGQGLSQSLIVALRLLIILLSGAWVVRLKPRDFILAFRVVRLPETLSVMIMMTLRFLPVLAGKMKQSLSLLKTRGIEMKRLPIRMRLNLYTGLIVPILGWTLKDVNSQAIALDGRGFRNGIRHTRYQQKRLRAIDYVLICLSVALLVLPGILL
jgi:energy-coupling factor transport system permease protein